jgi:hypothetical protein
VSCLAIIPACTTWRGALQHRSYLAWQLVELEVVALRILEGRHPAPFVLGDSGWKVHPFAIEVLDRRVEPALGPEGYNGPAASLRSLRPTVRRV